jgi:hypothetical protein
VGLSEHHFIKFHLDNFAGEHEQRQKAAQKQLRVMKATEATIITIHCVYVNASNFSGSK